MSKIKVLQIVSGIAFGEQAGGAEKHALTIAQRLNPQRFDSAVFSLWQYNTPLEQQWRETIATIEIPLLGMVPHSAGFRKIIPALWQAINQFQPDIISSHSERGDWLTTLMRLFHPRHPHLTRTIHIDKMWQTHPRIGHLLERWVFPYTFAQELAVSRSIYDELVQKRKNSDQLQLCYNAIDEQLFVDGPTFSEAPAGLPSGGPFIGIVGRLTDQKGHHLLLSAFANLLRESFPHAQLIVVGDGPNRHALEQMAAELSIVEQVHFWGVRQDIPHILSSLDLFVLPSFWEGFPTVLLEAMAFRVPVVASDVSGSRELVRDGETGRLVPPGDTAVLESAMRYLLTHPEAAARMAAEAHRHASQFTWEQMIARYTAVYEQIFSQTTGQ